MTARERAIDATWDSGGADWTTVDRERLEKRVEQAIIDAVEEEREACAKVAEDFREEAARWPDGAEYYKTACSVIHDRIRARGAGRGRIRDGGITKKWEENDKTM
jgi:hypothetical protein